MEPTGMGNYLLMCTGTHVQPYDMCQSVAVPEIQGRIGHTALRIHDN